MEPLQHWGDRFEQVGVQACQGNYARRVDCGYNGRFVWLANDFLITEMPEGVHEMLT